MNKNSCKLLAAIFLIASICCSNKANDADDIKSMAAKVSIGMTRDDVVQLLGEPQAESRSGPDGQEISLHYASATNALMIKIEDGKVVGTAIITPP